MPLIPTHVPWTPRMDGPVPTGAGRPDGPPEHPGAGGDGRTASTATSGSVPGSNVSLSDPLARFETDVVARASSQQQTAFRNLTAEQKQQFVSVHGLLSAGDQTLLFGQLTKGRLTQRDRQGQTTLAHLDRARTVPMGLPNGEAAPTYRARQIAALIGHLANPVNIQQGQRNTCGPTTAQFIFAAMRPADYVGFAVGLLSRNGAGRLPNGQTIGREASSFSAAQDDRPAVSRMIQASLMHWASPVSYTDGSDSQGVELPLVGRVNLVSGSSGMMMAEWMRAMRQDRSANLATTGISEIFDGGGPVMGVRNGDVITGIAQDLQRQRRNGHVSGFVPVELEWRTDKSMHWIAVTAMTDDRVYFNNPHGNLFDAFRNDSQHRPRPLQRDPANGLDYVEAPYADGAPVIRLYADGTQSMARSVLEARVLGAVVDANLVSRHQNSPANRFDPPF